MDRTVAWLTEVDLLDRRQAPVDFRLPMLAQPVVCSGKMPAANEAAIGRQRRGVRRLEHEMMAGVDQPPLGLGRAAPEQEDQTLAAAVEAVDDGIGEAFPALALMRAGAAALDRQHGVEQQYALSRPGQQAAMARSRSLQVALDLSKDVFERGRRRYARQHREAQTVRLSR